jgi:hypothetical protein
VDQWSAEEDASLIEQVNTCGTRWSVIARQLRKKRTPTAYCNRWYKTIKRKKIESTS